MTRSARDLEVLLRDIRRCRICLEEPLGAPLPHAPRPILRASTTAKLCICSQAPGVRVHASGRPFADASGERLRAWLAVTAEEFYDEARVAIVPMSFCFPGHDTAGGDLPPRPECARRWHAELFAHLPQLELVLLVGSYAQRWHLGLTGRETAAQTVARWRSIYASAVDPRRVPLPHPSWHNNAWLKANRWFETELLAFLRPKVRRLL